MATLLKLFLLPVGSGAPGACMGTPAWRPLRSPVRAGSGCAAAQGSLSALPSFVDTKHVADVPLLSADAYEHIATVLPNVTRFPAGRRLLLQPGRGLLQALASQVGLPAIFP